MATGYTAAVGEKDDYSFDDFIWQCARAFGPLIHMRDDGFDAKIELPQESSYYKDSVQIHTEELEELKEMTLEQAAAALDKEYAASQKSAKEGM